MIFQEPMASLNPCFTVGFQIDEVLRVHMGLDRGAAPRPRHRASQRGRHSRAGRAAGLLSAPDVGRHEPARDDRHGDRLQSEAADRRRADHRARRDHPGADSRPPDGAAGRTRHGADPDHPRYGRRRRNGRSRHRPVQGRKWRRPTCCRSSPSPKSTYTMALLSALARERRPATVCRPSPTSWPTDAPYIRSMPQ